MDIRHNHGCSVCIVCILYSVLKMGFVNTEPGLNPLKLINVKRKMKRLKKLNVAKIIICCKPIERTTAN